MIKCNRCGKMTPAGTVCQACGAPLTGMVDNGPAQRMGFQDQPELPAWLESLRAGERPTAPPANNAPNFSPADLVDDGALPSWMRSERGDARENMASNPPVSAQPNQFPDQGAPGGNVPPQGITAQSLIDEKSLPSWMQEGASSGTSPQPAPGGLVASSLVQPDNVPDWMRTLQSSSAAPRPNPTPAAPQPTARLAEPPASPTVTPGFSARDLVDQQSLPSWMQPQNEPAGRESNASVNPINQIPQPPARPAEPPASPIVTPGFSARDLVDQQSLPSWMQPQNEPAGRESNASANPINQTPPTASGAQNGFSASSLLDVDALPSWLREGAQGSGQQSRANNTVAPTPQQPAWPAQAPVQPGWNQGQSGSAWPAAGGQTPPGMQAPMQTPPANAMPQQEGGQLSASSFIDPNSLPEWLRSSGGQPGTAAQPQGPGSRPSGYGVPARPDNMRVPSRPRNEVNPSESSELAANVFASMLGVASATPNYPVPQPGGQPGQPQPQAFGQTPSGVQPPYTGQAQTGQGTPYSQPGQGNSYASSGQLGHQSGQWSQPGAMGQPGMPQNSLSGMPPSGPIPNTPMGSSGTFPQSYSGNSLSGTYGNAYPGSNQGQGNPAMGANPSMGGQAGANAGSPYAGNAYGSQASSDSTSGQKSNKKRGLFEAIREWLSR